MTKPLLPEVKAARAAAVAAGLPADTVARQYGPTYPSECPDCGRIRQTAETMRAHRQIAHGIPSGLAA